MATEIRTELSEFAEGNYCLRVRMLNLAIRKGEVGKETFTSGLYEPCLTGGAGCTMNDFYLNNPEPD